MIKQTEKTSNRKNMYKKERKNHCKILKVLIYEAKNIKKIILMHKTIEKYNFKLYNLTKKKNSRVNI